MDVEANIRDVIIIEDEIERIRDKEAEGLRGEIAYS